MLKSGELTSLKNPPNPFAPEKDFILDLYLPIEEK
jgi:hypothetical protein